MEHRTFILVVTKASTYYYKIIYVSDGHSLYRYAPDTFYYGQIGFRAYHIPCTFSKHDFKVGMNLTHLCPGAPTNLTLKVGIFLHDLSDVRKPPICITECVSSDIEDWARGIEAKIEMPKYQSYSRKEQKKSFLFRFDVEHV